MIIKIKVSYGLVAIFAALHAGAVAILFLVELPVWFQLLAVGITLTSLYWVLTLYVLRRDRRAIDQLRVTANTDVQLRVLGNRTWRNASLLSRFIHPRLVLLRVRYAKRRMATTVVIAADAVDPDAFRRLRAVLLAPPRTQAE